MTEIHSTALVASGARLASDVKIGAYTVIGENVTIDSGTVIANHITITGHTAIGKNNNIFPYTSIGLPPQDLTYKGEPTEVIIGDGNTLREFVTVNRGAVKGGGRTVIGNNNFIMAYCHIAHDCLLEDNIIMANGVQLGGHIKIEKYASFGGLAAAHHFVTIGQQSFVGGLSRIIHDVPPFMIIEGHPARVRAVNIVGLERRGFSPEAIKAIKNAYKLIWHSTHTPAQAIKILEKQKDAPTEIGILVQSLKEMQKSKQGRARELLRKPGF